MAGSVNKVIILGNLGANPECKHLPSGAVVCELRIATSERFKDKQDQIQERTEWHRVVAWGKTAENCGKYLSKGRQVYLEGRLQTRSWDDKDGNKRYTTEIVADQVVFLGGGGERSDADDSGAGRGSYGGGRGASADRGAGRQDRARGGGEEWAAGADDPGPGGADDDIPF